MRGIALAILALGPVLDLKAGEPSDVRIFRATTYGILVVASLVCIAGGW